MFQNHHPHLPQSFLQMLLQIQNSFPNREAIVQRPLLTLIPQTSSIWVLKQWFSSVVLSFQRFDVELEVFLDEVQEGHSFCHVANPCLAISGVQSQELHSCCCHPRLRSAGGFVSPANPQAGLLYPSKVRMKYIPLK